MAKSTRLSGPDAVSQAREDQRSETASRPYYGLSIRTTERPPRHTPK